MYRSLCRMVLAATISLCASFASHASLVSLDNLYVFGDSLSDGGNYNGPGGPGVFPPPPYAGTRYSNGPTAVEYLWQAYNPGDTSFRPSNFGGTNYALGGATTGNFSFNAINPGVPAPLQPYFASQGGVANQVATFANSCTGCFDPNTSLFVVWAFANDVFTNVALSQVGLGVSPQALITNGVTNIVNAVLTLAGEGAENFLVPNLPDLGAIPSAGGNAAALTQLTLAFNFALAQTLTNLDQQIGADIIQFDAFSAVRDVLDNPGTYGFTNVTESCVDNLLNGRCNPATWAYWDGAHPTTAAAAILGARFAAAVPLPGSVWLLLVGLLLLAALRVSMSQRPGRASIPA